MSSRKGVIVIGCKPTKWIDFYNGVPSKNCESCEFRGHKARCAEFRKVNRYEKIRVKDGFKKA